MKRCPTCQKTFADTMRFCQIDGTSLVEDSAPPDDPFRTVVTGKEDILSAIPPADPFKTMIGSALPLKEDDDDLLQLDEPDPMKTIINPGTFGKQEINFDQIREDIKKDIPPPSSAPKDEQQSFGEIPQPLKFDEPDLDLPDSGVPYPETPFESKPRKLDSKPLPDRPPGQSPFNNSPGAAIPSPFDLSMPPGYLPPSTPIFNEPEQPTQPELIFNEPPPAPKQNPFEQFQSPPSAQRMQQPEWTPPPAPVANWQNQDIGRSTPFQPPVVAAQGQNQTLAIVSLVLGIIGILFCQLTAPVAMVTGFMARSKATQNPNEYGGSGLALAGIIMGAIGTLLLFLVALWFIFVLGATFNQI
jgi:Domain of unknown function (DUF4190)